MTTEKQILANQQNAKLGGVKTEEGKTISKLNALKHGILSKEILLPEEDENQLINIGKRLRTELQPTTEIEMILVERIIANTWRLKRALKAEREMIENDTKKSFGGEKTFGKALSDDFANYDTYNKFTRYETSLSKGIYKALHELERLQAKRQGQKVPLPVAIDVNVDSVQE